MSGHEALLPAVPPEIETLTPWVDAGVLGSTEVHTAATFARVSGERNPSVLLGLALAVRAPLRSHVCLEPVRVAEQVVVDGSDPGAIAALPWPRPDAWQDALEASPLVRHASAVADPDAVTPLVWDGERLYLDRYWRYEQAVADDLVSRAGPFTGAPDAPTIARLLDRTFGTSSDRGGPGDDPAGDRPRQAAATALGSRLSVLAGGPGTGKTRTVARLLAALLWEASEGATTVRVALTAPTGKAAARMTEAVRQAVDDIDRDVASGLLPEPLPEAVRRGLLDAAGTTIHRLLGANGRGGFSRGPDDQIPAEVLVVDEASMVDLPLMAHLLAAVRGDARLVLVGDPGQLASVEAGAVLADLVGPEDPASLPHGAGPLTGRVTRLRVSHRFPTGSPIDRLARAMREGDADRAIGVLTEDAPGLRWISDPAGPARAEVGRAIGDHAVRLIDAARRGAHVEALDLLGHLGVLCATRRGPHGVAAWRDDTERRLRARLGASALRDEWYVGRPLLITRNDHVNRLFNGDAGVVVARGERRGAVAFPGPDATDDRGTGNRGTGTGTDTSGPASPGEAVAAFRTIDPVRLTSVETLWAMTIHKSQGSEWDEIVVALPEPPSPILTRELLYTAVTRARRGVTLVATEAAIRAAVEHPIRRATGLSERLWPTPAPPSPFQPGSTSR